MMLYELFQKAQNIPQLRRKLVAAVFLFVLFIAFYWFVNHGRLDLGVTGVKQDNVTYTITNQKGRKTTVSSHKGNKLSKFLAKGNYEVLAQEGNSSYFAVVKVSGFLKKTSRQGSVSKESARTFVGNNPATCMFFKAKLLLSYECAGTYSDLNLHLPATSNTPSYTQPSPTAFEDELEGIVNTPQGTLVLLHATKADEEQDTIHTLYVLGDDASLTKPSDLKNLDPAKKFTLKAFREGFIIYDSDYSDVLYYPTIESQPIKLSLEQVNDKGYGPYISSAKNDYFAVAYTNLEYEPRDGQPEKQNPNSKTKININKAGNSRQLTFSKQYSSMSLCGNNKLCLLAGDRLEIYDISGSKQVLLYAVGNVSKIEDSSKGLLVSRDGQVIQLNVDKGEGFSSYGYGNYTFCGISVDDAGYTLCVINNRQLKVALRIDQTQSDSDSIDQKINALFDNTEIDVVSIYGKYIFISPGTDNNLDQIKNINSQIKKAVDKSGIDRNKYTIYNPYQDVQPEDTSQILSPTE